MKTYHVISDIHGCYNQFNEALKHWKTKDNLVLLGDYVDRGPDSKKVIDTILALEKEHPETIILSGNHDFSFSQWVLGEEHQHYYYQPSFRETLISYMGESRFKRSTRSQRGGHMTYNHLSEMRWLRQLPKYYETDNIIFVHAGINLHIPDWREDLNSMDIIREKFYRSQKLAEKTVVFGHTPTPFIHNDENNFDIWISEENDKIGIDGGVSMGGQLNTVIIDEKGSLIDSNCYK